MTYDEIIKGFDEHLKKSGCRFYSDIYIGMTSDAEKRLFEDHHVAKDEQWWVYAMADDENVAHQVKEHYLDKGMRGSSNNEKGNGNATIVYCYAITPKTKEIWK